MRILAESAGVSISPTEEWLDDMHVSLPHPLFENIRIYLWLCSTHEEKCGRNQLWASRPKGKRKFISADGFQFGWEWLWEQLRRDERRASPLTALTPAALYLDGWAKMNVSLAKAPFHQITLDEGLLHVCTMARIEIPRGEAELYENNPNCFRPVMFKGAPGPLLGMFTARLEKEKEAIMDKKDRIGNAYQGIMSNIALLEYPTAIHDIFVEAFMNRDMHLCKENISGFKTFLRRKLQYFKSWYNAMKKTKGRGASLTFISSRTWLNLRYTVCGFITFAEHVLANYNQDIYIPMLLSNTSFLEALFSHIHSLGGRGALSYPTRIASRNVRGVIEAINKSSSYSAEEYLAEPEIDDKHHTPGAIKELNNEINKR
jgi:hypothetical protein